MRNTGKITHWNEEKGYGFITPNSGTKQVFVHISALTNRALPPRVGQIVTFNLATDKRGRPCAAGVMREGEPPQKSNERKMGDRKPPWIEAGRNSALGEPPTTLVRKNSRYGESPPIRVVKNPRTGSIWSAILVLVVAVLVAAIGYSKYQNSRTEPNLPVEVPVRTPVPRQVSPQYRCDGRTHCTQMFSCAEAQFFLRNCPDVKMDGDADGVPCEDQWCN